MKSCPNINDPDYKRLVEEFGEGKATMIIDAIRDKETGEIPYYPNIEEGTNILNDALINDLDELFVIQGEEKKLQRMNEQIELINREISNIHFTSQNNFQKEALKKYLFMTDKLRKHYENNIKLIKQGKDPIKTISVSSFIGASEFKLDARLYLDYKNFGTFVHALAENASRIAKETGDDISDIMTEEYVASQREEFQKTNPFNITKLNNADIALTVKRLLDNLSVFDLRGCIFLPEVTIAGRTKNENILVGRIDLLVIDTAGNNIIVDFKTKKVEKMLDYDIKGTPFMLNDAAIFRSVSYNDYPILISRKDGSTIGVGESFKDADIYRRTAFDNWYAQLDVYENILIQNGMEVTEKIIPVLFYYVDANHTALKSYQFNQQDYYSQAYATYVKEQNVREPKKGEKKKVTYEEKMTSFTNKIKKIREAVNKEVPIGNSAEAKAKKEFIENFEIVPEEKKAIQFIKNLEAFTKNQYSQVIKEIDKEYKKTTLRNERYISILEARKSNLNKLLEIIKANKVDNATDLSRATTFFYIMDSMDIEMEKLDISVTEIMKEFDTIKFTDEDYTHKMNNIYSEILKIMDFNKALNPLINEAQNIVNDFRSSLKKDSMIYEKLNNLHSISQGIDTAFRKIGMKDAIDILMFSGEAVYTRVNEQLVQKIQPEINRLERKIKELQEGKGLSTLGSLIQRGLSYLDKSYKAEIMNKIGTDGSDALAQIEIWQRKIEQLTYLMQGIEFKEDSFEKYINGITDPYSMFYMSSQSMYNTDILTKNIFGDDFMATVSNSDPTLSQFVMMYKNTERVAFRNLMSDEKLLKTDELKNALFAKGLSIADLNKKITETREVIVIENGKEISENRFGARVPYTVEYQKIYNTYSSKSRQISKEAYDLKNQYHEANNKLKQTKESDPNYAEVLNTFNEVKKNRDNKIKEREQHFDKYTKWMTENSSLPFTSRFYELQMKLPVDLREKIQSLYIEQESILYGINKGFESMLEDDALDRIKEIEIEIKKLKKEYRAEHPEYVEALNQLNEYYEYDVNEKYFERVEATIKAMYKDEPELLEKWYKLNKITRPRKEWYEALQKLYEEREAIMPDLPEDIKERIDTLRRNKSLIISSYKPYGEFEPKFLIDEDIEELDAIENELDKIYEDVKSLKLYETLTDQEKVELKEINEKIKSLVTKSESEKYKEILFGDFDKLELLHTKMLQAENSYNEVNNKAESTEKEKDDAFKNYTASVKLFSNKEEEYKNWFNKNHYNTFEGYEPGNRKFMDFRSAKSFNQERVPAKEVSDIYLETNPHPKFYCKKKLRSDIWEMDGRILSTREVAALKALDEDVNKTIIENNIIVKPNAFNPNYVKSFNGVPLPKSIDKDENGHYVIKKGMENDININPKFLEIYNDAQIYEFYNSITDLYFGLQKQVDGPILGYEAPGFVDSIINNMLYHDNLGDVMKSQLRIAYDKSLNFKDSRYDEINETYSDANKLQMKYSKQFPESMQSKDFINCVYKYAVEAHYNKELQNIAPKMNLFIEFIKSKRDDLERMVQSNPIQTVEKNGVVSKVDMNQRLKEINKTIVLLEYERDKFQKGHPDTPIDKTAKKMINTLFRYSSFIRIGFDLANQTKNYLSGNIQAWLAAGNFKSNHYNSGDLWESKKLIYGEFFPNYFSDWGKLTGLHLTTLIYRDFNPMMKEQMKYIQGVAGGKKLRALDKATNISEMGFFFQDKGDTEIGITVMFSILKHYKYKKIKEIDSEGNKIYEKDADGNDIFVSALDAYFVNSKGLLERKAEIDYNESDERMLRNIIISEMRRAQGNYAKQDQTFFEQKVLGKMVFFFRKFLIPQLLNRFGYMRPNYEGAEVAYGYWRAVLGGIKYFGWGKTMGELLLGHKILNKFGIEGIEKVYQTDRKTGEVIKEIQVGDFWNSKISHARKDMFTMLALSILGYLALARLKQKDSEDEELSILEGNAIRVLWGVTGETVAMNPVFGGQKEYIRNFTQGIPFVREFQYIQKLITHGTSLAYVMTFTSGEEPDTNNDSLFYQRMYRDAFYAQQSGPYEQDSPKLIKDLVDMTGIRNLRDLLTPSNRLDVLKKNQ